MDSRKCEVLDESDTDIVFCESASFDDAEEHSDGGFVDPNVESDVEDPNVNMCASRVIDSLPNEAVFTNHDAQKAPCCLVTHTYSFPITPQSITRLENTTPAPVVVLLATGSMDEKLRVYKVTHDLTLESVYVAEDFTDSVVSVEFSFDGKFLAAGAYDASLVIYEILCDLDHVQVVYKHHLNGPTSDIEWIAWHPRGYALLAGSKDAVVWMWMANTARVLSVFSGHVGPVTCGCFANQGRVVATGGADGSVMVWDPKTQKRLALFDTTQQTTSSPPMNCIVTIVAHQHLPLIAVGSEDNKVRLFNIETRKLLYLYDAHHDTVETLAFLDSPLYNDNSSTLLLASGSLDGTCYIWDCGQHSSRISFKHSDLHFPNESVQEAPIVGGIVRLLYIASRNGKPPRLLTAGTDCTIRLWDLSSHQCLHVFSGHKACILDIQFISQLECIVSCSDDKTIKLWRLDEPAHLQ